MKCIHWRKLPFRARGLFRGSTILTASSSGQWTSQARWKVKALEQWVRDEVQDDAVPYGLSILDTDQRNGDLIMSPWVGIKGF